METLWVHVRAPFAAFRWLQAGVYRATSPVVPPSAAWGMLLNFAAIDTRASEAAATTVISESAPTLSIAIGARGGSERCTLYQQLHTYPVGNAGADLAARARGNKYWIAPAKREVLVRFDCFLGVRAEGQIADRIRLGLNGELQGERYGLPFAGDNNFLLEEARLIEEPAPCRWYVPMQSGDPPQVGSVRLTVKIDRSDSSRTSTQLFAPTLDSMTTPPAEAWTMIGPSVVN